MRRALIAALALVMVVAAYVGMIALGFFGAHEEPGEPAGSPVPARVVAAREGADRSAAQARGVTGGKRILFGDLHVHTTFSLDAFQASLPLTQGEGAHPPADACDFARFCSALDFWSINDHAEGITPRHWEETKESIRRCNDIAGDEANPDVVAYLGWEWTQVGQTPEDHYGHKNVIFRELGDDQVPARPISAGGLTRQALSRVPLTTQVALPLLDFGNRERYFALGRLLRDVVSTPVCEAGVDTRELPAECSEEAPTPHELLEKLDQWGFDSIVIPHGTTWGLYTPPGATWDKQLTSQYNDPVRQTLLEVYSGHGNSEEYRDYVAVDYHGGRSASCVEPTEGYLPACWRAGEIIRERCLAEGESDAECETRAAEARENHANAGVAGWHTVPGATVEDWLDAGQCVDCFQPAFNYRPGGSAQYTTALTNFDDPEPKRFRFGFIASSDNHTARPGTGYKEVARGSMSDRRGPRDETWARRMSVDTGEPVARSAPFDFETTVFQGFQLVEFERQTTFFLTGGLVAVHSESRGRNSIWNALARKEVYGTSGERILLWFDLVNAPGPGGDPTVLPMGSEIEMSRAPLFRARAIGAYRQLPGCPEYSVRGLTPERLEHVCRSECYNPSDERKLITRMEIIRIRPQVRAGEPVAPLVEDPWRVFPCQPDPGGCSVEFSDPDFPGSGRDAVYYARAVQESAPTINAGNLRCRYDSEGNCLEVDPCWGDYRTDPADDCLSPSEGRAWSSPIYVDRARGGS